MRRVPATTSGAADPRVHLVVSLEELAGHWSPERRYFVLAQTAEDWARVVALIEAGADNVKPIRSAALLAGDVVSVHGSGREVFVHYRATDRHHSLLLTNRCNSYCLMCSQPPTPQQDAWRVDEAIDIVHHMRESPVSLGLSGGEPLLLGPRLREVLDVIAQTHPATSVEVLTNGRLLAREDWARQVLEGLPAGVSWLVPLYGHADFLHDYVVQSPGAFEQTLSGLLSLQQHEQAIQLRVVLIEPVLRILPELCAFIARNLPFVREVALIVVEPIGFALANREQCEVDLASWGETLHQAARTLDRYGVPFLFMNAPLCGLPRDLWPHAQQSISDWKNVYAEECTRCAVKSRCAGLFAWHERGWQPTRVHAIEETPV